VCADGRTCAQSSVALYTSIWSVSVDFTFADKTISSWSTADTTELTNNIASSLDVSSSSVSILSLDDVPVWYILVESTFADLTVSTWTMNDADVAIKNLGDFLGVPESTIVVQSTADSRSGLVITFRVSGFTTSADAAAAQTLATGSSDVFAAGFGSATSTSRTPTATSQLVVHTQVACDSQSESQVLSAQVHEGVIQVGLRLGTVETSSSVSQAVQAWTVPVTVLFPGESVSSWTLADQTTAIQNLAVSLGVAASTISIGTLSDGSSGLSVSFNVGSLTSQSAATAIQTAVSGGQLTYASGFGSVTAAVPVVDSNADLAANWVLPFSASFTTLTFSTWTYDASFISIIAAALTVSTSQIIIVNKALDSSGYIVLQIEVNLASQYAANAARVSVDLGAVAPSSSWGSYAIVTSAVISKPVAYAFNQPLDTSATTFDVSSSNTDYTYTIPANTAKLFVKLWGAGGGGQTNQLGGGGGYAAGTLSVVPGMSLSVRVGAGGSGCCVGRCSGKRCAAAYGGGGATYQGNSGGGGSFLFLNGYAHSNIIAAAGGGGGGGGGAVDSKYLFIFFFSLVISCIYFWHSCSHGLFVQARTRAAAAAVRVKARPCSTPPATASAATAARPAGAAPSRLAVAEIAPRAIAEAESSPAGRRA
jgi:hypothetical protein